MSSTKIREYEIERKNIGSIVKTKSISELKDLVNNLNKLSTLKNIGNDYRISFVIESAFESCSEIGMQLLQYCIENGFYLNYFRIISTYYGKGYNLPALFVFADNQERSLKADIIIACICIVDNPSTFISEQDFNNAIRYHKSEVYTIDELYKKYYSTNILDRRSRSIFASILWRCRNAMPISGSEEFILDFIKKNQSKTNLAGYAYIKGICQQDHFDYQHKLLKCILQNYPSFWVECCKVIPTFVRRYHITPYDFIWDIENYSTIIESTLLYYASMNWIPFDEKDNLFSFFCNIKNDRAANFIDEVIKKYCHNHHISSLLFEIVATSMGDYQVQNFITFITHNTNIDDFMQLDLFSHSMWGGDSFAPTIKLRIEFIESLIDAIKK